MLVAGDVYQVNVPGDKTDHYWLIVTDRNQQGEIVYAMLTDARNLDFPTCIFPAGTEAWGDFKLSKITAIDAARAGIRPADEVERAFSISGIYQGSAKPKFLSDVRKALRHAAESPRRVREALGG